MRNVDIFFKVLEKFNNLENKKVGNVIKATEIVIYKNNKGFNIYFGIRNDNCHLFHNYIVKSEEEFVQDGTKSAFIPNTCVYLENVSETELDAILFLFNKKYSVTNGPFATFFDKLQIVQFTASPDSMINTSIWLNSRNVPLSIKIHLNGTKNAYFKFAVMSYSKRREEIKASEKISYKEYIQMLETMKSNNATSYLVEAYNLSYKEYLDYLSKLEVLEKEQSITDCTSLLSAQDFLKR